MKSPPYRGVSHTKRFARLSSVLHPWGLAYQAIRSTLLVLHLSQAYRSLACNALERASPDAECLGHLQDTHALPKLLSHPTFGRAVYLRTAELYALGDGAL